MAPNRHTNLRVAIDGMLVDQCVSGVETAIYGLATALARHGARDYSFYMRANGRQPDVEAERFHTCRCRIPGRSRLLRLIWAQTALPARLRREKIDILHSAGYIAPRFAGVPVVITVYDLIALQFPQLCRGLNALNYRLQLPSSIRRAAGIIAPSAATRNDLVQQFPEAAAKTAVIPLAIDDVFRRSYDEAQQAVRSKYGLPPRFILFVGQIEPKKNVAGILRAYRRLLDDGRTTHGLVIAGNRGWGCDQMDQLLSSLKLHDQVVFPGFVAREDLPALYSAAAVFVFPSFYEGFGLPPLEAMACGTPVVVSDRGSLPELTEGASAVCPPDDVDALAAGICTVLDNETYRSHLIERGFARASGYTWENTARRTDAFYHDVLEW